MTNSTVDISIVIVNYNVKDFLHQCLTSVEKASKGLSVEVIVVDNASTDGSVDFIEPLFPNYKFISSAENLGFAKANNIAIKQSNGRYLLILNPDTILAEDTLSSMVSYMESNTEVGIAGCKVLNSDGSFQIQCRRGFPTPWVSFCKLFGLQKIFPQSKLFSKYNQTFQSIDATYYIDAVIGAFMFCDTKLIQKIGGFDESYFMYGEDLDLCRQVQLKGRKVAYYHQTTIIHFKGESTRRSSLDEIRQQYSAMEKFARKYFSNSAIFILFLRLGILFRSLIARVIKHKQQIFIALCDLIFINLSYTIGTYAKFGEFFGLPDYAYPWIFIFFSLVFFLSQFLNGEYFENNISIPKTVLSLMLSFFILSTIPYFFPSLRFSRGALLVAIGLTTILSVLLRFGIIIFERVKGQHSDRRVIIAGCDDNVDRMIEAIQDSENQNINILGIVRTSERWLYTSNYQYLGELENISIIVEKNKANEVIITDTNLPSATVMQLMSHSIPNVKYHIIPEYDELVTSRIINEIANSKIEQFRYNINKPRFRFLKRTSDILLAFLTLTLCMPYLLLGKKRRNNINKWWNVLLGRKTAIGIYSNGLEQSYGKEGIISLAQINQPAQLTINSINKLNEYYMQNYSLSLDTDIIIKYFIRRK